jgi:PKD repeat protein
MKKLFILFSLCLSLSHLGWSQSIVNAEYFFDTDPGIGNGLPLTISAPGDSVDENINISIAALLSGNHILYIRTQDALGKWSLYEPRAFQIAPVLPSDFELVSGEYFFNTDPGFGNGLPLTAFAAGDSIDVQTTISIAGLPVGQHKLYIRMRDQNGHYSLYEPRDFNINAPAINEQVVAAEYFFDTDPGVGNGTPINTGSASDSIDLNFPVTVPSLALGSHNLYVRTKNADGHWSLFEGGQMNICTTYGADANFSYTINSKTVFFTDSSNYFTSHLWDFGDGQQDTVKVNPQHEYANGGAYTVCRTAQSSCGNDTYCTTVIINGIQSISPAYGGDSGFVSTVVRGYGFEQGSLVKLIRTASPDIMSDTTVYISPTELRVNFKMRGEVLGFYDVVLINPSTAGDTLENGFEVQTTTPMDQWVQVVGNSFIRVLTNNTFRIAYGNNSNVAALGVQILITVPGDRNITLGIPIDTINLPPSVRDSIPFWNDHYVMLHDTITGDSTKAMLLFAPLVRAGETQYIDIVQMQTAGGYYQLTAKIFDPLFTSAEMDSMLKANPSGNIIQSSCGKLSHSACFDCMLEILGAVPVLGCPVGIPNLGCSIAGAAAGNQGITWDDVLADISGTILSCVTAGIPAALAEAVQWVGYGTGFYNILTACLAPGGCFGGKKSAKQIKVVTPGDPNVKFGPSGWTAENYFSGDDVSHYSIYFENMPSATAPAADVFVTDTLDASVFDLNSFFFTSFGFGDSVYYLDDKPSSFTMDIDMRPTKDIILRVHGHRDGNILNFRFSSFDPVTMAITDSIFEGFLPPNVTYPEGVGFFRYSVKPKTGMPHLTQLKNYATIYFDQNPPIATPVWTNTIDKEKPQSAVDPLSATQTDTTFKVTWNGTDAHAGMMDYTIYFSDNNGPYMPWLVDASNNANYFEGQAGHTYKFYSIARDRAMNVEDNSGLPDAETTVLIGMDELEKGAAPWIKVTPNPFSEESTVDIYLAQNLDVSLVLTDIAGRDIKTLIHGKLGKGKHTVTLNADVLSNGIYFLKLASSNNILTKKLILMRQEK